MFLVYVVDARLNTTLLTGSVANTPALIILQVKICNDQSIFFRPVKQETPFVLNRLWISL